jgi:hypothetical protein
MDSVSTAGAASLAPWLLAAGLAMAGARIAVGSASEGAAAQRTRWGTLAAALAFITTSLIVGGQRVPELPRMAALPPTFTLSGHREFASRTASGSVMRTDEGPRPREYSPYTFFVYLPIGGLGSLRTAGKQWRDVANLHVAQLDPGELCGLFHRVPSLCIHERGVPSAILAMLRSDAEALHATERVDCPDLEGTAIFAGDGIDDVAETALPPGTTSKVSILKQPVVLSASRNRDGATTITLQPPGDAAAAVTLADEAQDSLQLTVGGARVRLRISSRQEDGVARVRLHDLHLVCP